MVRSRFSFRPYFYGPYSEGLDSQLRELIAAGLVEEKPYLVKRDEKQIAGYEYALTPSGLEVVSGLRDQARERMNFFKSIADKFGTIPLDRLLSWVYREYPFMVALSARE